MAKTGSDDPVKKIFGKTAKEIFATEYPPLDPKTLAVCAGEEEWKHINYMFSELSDDEIYHLIEDEIGIRYGGNVEEERKQYENLVGEAYREEFYGAYNRILNKRPKDPS